jgi:choline dehydrogenase
MKDKKCIIPRGKLIGGSSAINVLMYVRGNPKDYDKWAELGNPGWSYEDVLPYFIKSENSQIDGDEGYHGKGGFWNVEYALPPSEIFPNFVDGNDELNASIVDYNGRNQIGAAKTQLNTKRGRRQSTGTAFLDNARKRKNLTVVTKALVTKINIDPESKVARGVEFVRQDQKYTVAATKEVIVSGGAINSPQLLMLSGIGPKDHLEELGIEVVADLPVGKKSTGASSLPRTDLPDKLHYSHLQHGRIGRTVFGRYGSAVEPFEHRWHRFHTYWEDAVGSAHGRVPLHPTRW